MAAPVHENPATVVEDEPPYEYQDALSRSTRSALITGAAGALLAAVQNTVARDQTSPFGVFTRFGGTIGIYGTIGRSSGPEAGGVLTVHSGNGRHVFIRKNSLSESAREERLCQ